MTYQNRSRRLLLDFSWIGLGGGGLIAVISAYIISRGGSERDLVSATAWLGIGQTLASFGALAVIGFIVAKSVAYDIRNAHLPEYTERVPEPGEVPVAKPDADPVA